MKTLADLEKQNLEQQLDYLNSVLAELDNAETEKVEQLTDEQAKAAEAEAALEEQNEVIIEAEPEDEENEE